MPEGFFCLFFVYYTPEPILKIRPLCVGVRFRDSHYEGPYGLDVECLAADLPGHGATCQGRLKSERAQPQAQEEF